jgi:hypothetical protein
MEKFPFEARNNTTNKKPKRKIGGEKAIVLNKPNTQATKQKNPIKKKKERKKKRHFEDMLPNKSKRHNKKTKKEKRKKKEKITIYR